MKNILIPLSLWDTTDQVVALGIQQARAFQSTAWLLHVIKIPPQLSRWPKELREQRKKEIERLQHDLQARAAALSGAGAEAKALIMEDTDVVEAILKQADRCEADLIVMGSHGRGVLYGALLGDVARDILHRAPCPVLIVPMQIQKKAQGARERQEM